VLHDLCFPVHFRRESCGHAARRTGSLLVTLSVRMAASGMCRGLCVIGTSNLRDNSDAIQRDSEHVWLLAIATRRYLSVSVSEGAEAFANKVDRELKQKWKFQQYLDQFCCAVTRSCCFLINKQRIVINVITRTNSELYNETDYLSFEYGTDKYVVCMWKWISFHHSYWFNNSILNTSNWSTLQFWDYNILKLIPKNKYFVKLRNIKVLLEVTGLYLRKDKRVTERENRKGKGLISTEQSV
jgi:hypothetical protein